MDIGDMTGRKTVSISQKRKLIIPQWQELLLKFKEIQRNFRPAMESMLEDAAKAAYGEGEFYTSEDIFGRED